MFDRLPKMPLLPVKKKWRYIILYSSINCPFFIVVKQTLHYKVAIGYI